MRVEKDETGPYVTLDRSGYTAQQVVDFAYQHGAFDHEGGQLWIRVKLPGETRISSLTPHTIGGKLAGQPLPI